MKEIDALKEKGFKVKVSHLRYCNPRVTEMVSEDGSETVTTISVLQEPVSIYKLRERDYDPFPYGGTTVVRVIAPNGVEFKEVVGCSALDLYNKQRGILIGLGRIAKSNGITL